MSLASWLAEGAEPGRMTPEEVRRLRNALQVREEQVVARLEAAAGEQADLVDRGTWTTSTALRRALARRHIRLDEDVIALDRELGRVGKELAGLASIQTLLRDGVALAAPGDCAPLLAVLDDVETDETEFAEQLERALRAGQVQRRPARRKTPATDLMKVWERLDRGEIADAREALRRTDEPEA